ncbi:uncharacterized protein LOC132264907 isoform X2 [Phlebotomus argentipes]|uniref:uncharacterized protein LOC132264907 isoform X2 n=1 Tax=Phlebotomus argentipes TaxID=94469 RepID=UPI002892C9A5|nr:uncharacterized protein LOC132264907 isoform X2 [Phlebotomus argentipes]
MSQSTQHEDSLSGDSVENFCKKVLKSRVFLGEFKEKRLVSSLESYRDVIVVDVQSESAIANDLDIVYGKLIEWLGERNDNHWIGLTRTSSQPKGGLQTVLVWTELDSFYPFGKYWFQIKTVRFREHEILLKLKVLRSAEEPTPRGNDQEVPFKWEDIDWPLFERIGRDSAAWAKKQLTHFLVFLLSVRVNAGQIVAAIKMIVLGVVFAVASSIQAIQLLGNFSLRFVEETRKCIHVLTPLILGTLDIFSKIVGGFYMLIAMVWRDSINLKVGNRNRVQAIEGPRGYNPQIPGRRSTMTMYRDVRRFVQRD